MSPMGRTRLRVVLTPASMPAGSPGLVTEVFIFVLNSSRKERPGVKSVVNGVGEELMIVGTNDVSPRLSVRLSADFWPASAGGARKTWIERLFKRPVLGSTFSV